MGLRVEGSVVVVLKVVVLTQLVMTQIVQSVVMLVVRYVETLRLVVLKMGVAMRTLVVPARGIVVITVILMGFPVLTPAINVILMPEFLETMLVLTVTPMMMG